MTRRSPAWGRLDGVQPAPRLIVPLDRPPDTSVVIPGSKSHTNRALVCAALAEGTSVLRGALFADDTAAMIGGLGALGVEITAEPGEARLRVTGCGGRLPNDSATLDVRQSGTTSRFLLPVLALGPGPYVLDGDPQLRARPFGDLVAAMTGLGARVQGTRLPLTIERGSPLGGTIRIPGTTSSQFLSGLLLGAPCAGEETILEVDGDLVSKPYVDLTLDTMAQFGAEIDREGYRRFVVAPTGYDAADIAIEPDASAASYLFAAAMPGGRVRIEGLGTGTVQGDLRFVDALEAMGAEVIREEDATEVRGPVRPRGIEIDMADISDTAQTLAVVATFAVSPTRITGIGFIRHKETDRLRAVVDELGRLGIEAIEEPDGLTVHPGRPAPGTVETYDDHRMAMSFALLGLRTPGISIANPGCVAKTFPTFFDVLETLRT
jgi:3-phosphoshikimate 1-carboxyvinyltransferase